MIFKITISIFTMLISLITYSQDKLIALTIDPELKENTNAVIRLNNIILNIEGHNKFIYKNKRIVTVLSKSGKSDVGAYMHYSNNTNIKKIEAIIYDAFGQEIKKVKKKHFKDASAVDGGSLYSDSRVKYLDYTPINYPYTIVFETEVEYKSTAFIPGWKPIEGSYVSTEESNYKINNTSGVELKIKTQNFDNYNIEKLGDYNFVAKKIKALKQEAYAPAFNTYAPSLRVALTKFVMEGVEGINTNWQDFGKWVDDKLIHDTQELPASVKAEIKQITANETSNIEKAKLVYKYMQDKTRYISVQVGIGGWKPMLASDVDRLGYGDCKALTNYTKALLDAIDVESYYTLIYGGRNIQNIDKEFSATQGNHAILAVPHNEDYIWLECTNQTVPFGYNANFTDDRDALIITPEGGKIVHTKAYSTKENLQTTKAKVKLDEKGSIFADVNIASRGTQYDYHSEIEKKNEKDKKLYYKNYFDNINNLEFHKIAVKNNKNEIIFTEDVNLAASKYVSKAGNRLLFAPNMFNKRTNVPPRYKSRKLPFKISRGFTDVDEYEIELPETIEVEALMKPATIENQFGSYSVSIEKKANNLLVYKRTLVINKGDYKKEDYNQFRDFYLKIVKHDKSKIALKTIK